MRDIRLRAWDKEEHRIYKDICNVPYCINIRNKKRLVKLSYFMSNKNRFEISEFTGFVDDNGKEIYEGDIVFVENEYWVSGSFFGKVEMKNGHWCLVDEYGDYAYLSDKAKSLRVVGNIYTEPENKL